jgi:hypothetical protein
MTESGHTVTSSNVTIDRLDWASISEQLGGEGYAMLPGLLHTDEARDLAGQTEGKGATRPASLESGELGVASCSISAPTGRDRWRGGAPRSIGTWRPSQIAGTKPSTIGIRRKWAISFDATRNRTKPCRNRI